LYHFCRKRRKLPIIDQDKIEELPKFCRLDLRTIVERAHEQFTAANNLLFRRVEILPLVLMLLVKLALSPNLELIQKSAQKASTHPPSNNVNNPSINSAKPLAKGTYTIACIDDSPTVLNAINSFLDDKSFSVVMINDPVRALMQVVRIKPDLILLDVEMPNLDGYELCSLLRKHSLFKTTPIIMVTGNTGFLDRAKAKLVRASGYLTKPFNQSELLKMVFKHLS
jgi:twitching motility two-component system response regulator PilG